MHIPPHFEEKDVDAIRGLIHAYPLATLVVHSLRGLLANHIPMYLTEAETGNSCLCGHIPRANSLSERNDGEALAIFTGADAYISPSWYATKQQTGKVVPTWNYAVVHAHGTLKVIDDSDWVMNQLETLTNMHESRFDVPWKVSDAPSDYIERLVRNLVGIEISVDRFEAKTKASQNHPKENRIGVINGLEQQGNAAAASLVPDS